MDKQMKDMDPKDPINIGKDLVFNQYPSIEPSIRQKTIKNIRNDRFDKDNIMWVASEKIHGSNFSIHCAQDKIKYGRRNDFLTQDIPIKCKDPGPFFKQKFFDAKTLVQTFHNKIGNIWTNLKQLYPEMMSFIIYGEYFGGHFPENNDKTLVPVQKGIYYTPKHQFMVFDIKIVTNKQTFWVDVQDIPKCLKGNLDSVPIYARGTFDQMMALNTKIDSTIPELLGLNKVENNIIQGFVIRPNKNLQFKNKNNQRVILKKKNKQFLQVAKAQNAIKQPKKKAANIQPEIVPFIEALQAYLNHNRIQSVMSKFPDLKDKHQLKLQIVRDIMSDALKDQYKQPEADLSNKVKIQLNKKVVKMLDQYNTNMK